MKKLELNLSTCRNGFSILFSAPPHFSGVFERTENFGKKIKKKKEGKGKFEWKNWEEDRRRNQLFSCYFFLGQNHSLAIYLFISVGKSFLPLFNWSVSDGKSNSFEI